MKLQRLNPIIVPANNKYDAVKAALVIHERGELVRFSEVLPLIAMCEKATETVMELDALRSKKKAAEGHIRAFREANTMLGAVIREQEDVNHILQEKCIELDNKLREAQSLAAEWQKKLNMETMRRERLLRLRDSMTKEIAMLRAHLDVSSLSTQNSKH